MTEKELTKPEQKWIAALEEDGRAELERFGRILDQRPASLRGRTVGMALAEQLLLVRTREGGRRR